MDQAQPEAVASWARDHWAIENRLHWIRDVVTGEDRHQLRTANGPFGLGRPAQPRHQPHQTLPRPPSPHRRHHQSHGPTPRTSHRPDHPTNHLNRLCRPPGPPPRAVKSLAALAAGGSASRPAPPAATTWRCTQLLDTAHEVVKNMMPDYYKETLKAFGRHDRRSESRHCFHERSQRS
ncbi:hypothetical protein [Actinomyces sp. oral taxon 414]|uniref:hypothetical protein n=1 Tax=Actinomyces sp. oral taxon 414 TaxID=712122 RepID=UPI003F889C40